MYNGSNTSQNTKNSVPNSKEVLHTFMMDHNFTKPSIERPPAIGEEQGHDDHSNSSISGKSEVSNSTPRCLFIINMEIEIVILKKKYFITLILLVKW